MNQQKVKINQNTNELNYKGYKASFINKWVECNRKNSKKRVMLGGFKRECSYTFNGVPSKKFTTIKEAKESFMFLIDTIKLNIQRTNVKTKQVDFCTQDEAINDLKQYWGDAAKYLLKGRYMWTPEFQYQMINL